jgi:hypothetical protein
MSWLLWKCPFRLQRYSFITTPFLGPFDDVIAKFYCIYTHRYIYYMRDELKTDDVSFLALNKRGNAVA